MLGHGVAGVAWLLLSLRSWRLSCLVSRGIGLEREGLDPSLSHHGHDP